MAQPGNITQLLQRIDDGDRAAGEQLFVLVQEDLKAIARKRKRLLSARGDAATTLLVDEAFLRLVGQGATVWEPGDRRKFFGYASKKIHEMLIKAGRAEATAKRGGGRQRVVLDGEDLPDGQDGGAVDLDLQIDLKEALDCFEAFAPNDALLFRIRYFLGCTFEELAEMLGVSLSETKRAYERARLWLEEQLKEYGLDV